MVQRVEATAAGKIAESPEGAWYYGHFRRVKRLIPRVRTLARDWRILS